MFNIYNFDVLVIGSGGAGCRAALEASKAHAKVGLITKGLFGKSGTTAFRVADTAGFNVPDGVVDNTDSPEAFYNDIINAGLGMVYEELADMVANESFNALRFLESIGVEFEKDPMTGNYIEVKGCYSTKPRMHVLRDHGERIIRALTAQIKKQPIKIFEETMITQLVVNNGICVGAIGLDSNGNPVGFSAKAVIIACGGAGQLFKHTLTPKDITGDGYVLGLRAGAELVNMEFMQVVLGTVVPTKNQLNTFLWCAHPELLNAKGEQFLASYLPEDVTQEECKDAKSTHFPFSSRDISKYIEISIMKEIRKNNGTPRGSVFLDLTKINDEVILQLPPNSPLPKVWPIINEFLKKRGFKIDKEPIEVTCFAHAINGGIKINKQCETTIEGLFAAGEVAGGPHGADRLGGNMLLTCQIFGERAGKVSAERAKRLPDIVNDDLIIDKMKSLEQFELKDGSLSIDDLKARLQEAMWKGALVVKSEESLIRTLNEINDLRTQLSNIKINNTSDIKNLLELENLLDLGEVICKASLYRKESRGSHYREDYPFMSDEWNSKIIIKMRDGKIRISKEE